MKQITKMFSLTLLLLLGTMLLILGPTAIVGVAATLLNLPDFLGISLVVSVFAASAVTALSKPYLCYWEQRFSSSDCF